MNDDKYILQVQATRMLDKRFKSLYAFPAALKKIIPVKGDPATVWKSTSPKTTEKRKLVGDEDGSNFKRHKANA